jgi:hypothetical protein
MDPAQPAHSLRSDAAVLSGFAAILLVIHFLIGNGYGFHRDEFQFLDDARHLQWGFVAYPPMTAFWGRVAIALFGISPQVFRLPAAIFNAVWLVLAGLSARELGGRRPAQILTLLVAFPVALAFSSVLQYNTFDVLAWSTLIYFTARVLRTGDPRFWLGAGVGVGLGVLSKYTIAFPTVSLLAALLILPSQRHHLRSRWFWYGALTAALIAAPNLIWLASHHFITLRMEQHIHARDVRNGRADSYYSDQIKYTLLALPLAVIGLVALVRDARYRLLSAFYIGPFVLLALSRGRGYYLMPAYPLLYAAGVVSVEKFFARRTQWLRVGIRALIVTTALLGVAAIAWAFLPIWPAGSAAWNWQMKNNEDMANEIGWPEFVAQVAAVRNTLPESDRSRLAILAHNYGEAGALELWGAQYGLPTPISSTNSFHDRGYGPYEPETVIVVGSNLSDQLFNFASCSIAGYVRMPRDVRNEESVYHPEILICRHLRLPWPVAWARSQEFG